MDLAPSITTDWDFEWGATMNIQRTVVQRQVAIKFLFLKMQMAHWGAQYVSGYLKMLQYS
jgi:hypothetical protein